MCRQIFYTIAFFGSLKYSIFSAPKFQTYSSKEAIWEAWLQDSQTAAYRSKPATFYKVHCRSTTGRSHSSASPTASYSIKMSLPVTMKALNSSILWQQMEEVDTICRNIFKNES